MSASRSAGTPSVAGSRGTCAARMRSSVDRSELPANSRSAVMASNSTMPTLNRSLL